MAASESKQVTVQVPTTVDGNPSTREVSVSKELYDQQMALAPEKRNPKWRNIEAPKKAAKSEK